MNARVYRRRGRLFKALNQDLNEIMRQMLNLSFEELQFRLQSLLESYRISFESDPYAILEVERLIAKTIFSIACSKKLDKSTIVDLYNQVVYLGPYDNSSELTHSILLFRGLSRFWWDQSESSLDPMAVRLRKKFSRLSKDLRAEGFRIVSDYNMCEIFMRKIDIHEFGS